MQYGKSFFLILTHIIVVLILTMLSIPPNPSWAAPSDTINSLTDEPGLGFLFVPYRDINELQSFGIQPWGVDEEEHFGIDIIPLYQSADYQEGHPPKRVKVVAPADGTIRLIAALDSPEDEAPGNKDIAIIIEMNSYWSIILNFEPKSSPGKPVQEQIRSIGVQAGQEVKKGDNIGYLVVGEGIGGYPHVHYALMYKHPSVAYWSILQDIVPVPNLDPEILGVPRTGPGSPWEPEELILPAGAEAAFFCPYEFSSDRAKHIFENIIDNTQYPCGPILGKCSCICIYDNICETD